MASFLQTELQRPLAQLRREAHSISQTLPKALTLPEATTILESLQKKHKDPSIQEGLQTALTWLKSGETNELTQTALGKPETQCALGLALFLNQILPEENQHDTTPIQTHPRLLTERENHALLCASFLGDAHTQIGFGSPNSWFYFDPTKNLVNIDLGQSLLLGLQNTRAILLHEIGHSHLTKGRTPKMEELQTSLQKIAQKPLLNKEEAIEALAQERELSYRENAFQYLEDAAVNLFAEKTGENANQDIVVASLRNYAVIGLSRNDLDPSSLWKTLPEDLQALLPPDTLGNRLKILGYAFPLAHNLAGEDPHSWELLGLDLHDPERKTLLEETLTGPTAAAKIQPLLQTSRIERLDKQKLHEATQKTWESRRQRFDQIFDNYLLPLLETERFKSNLRNRLPGKIPNPNGYGPKLPTNDHPPQSNPEKPTTHQPIGEILQERTERIEKEALKTQESRKAEAQKREGQMQEALKHNASKKDIFEDLPELPEGKETYEDAVEACQEHIQTLSQTWEKIILRQKLPQSTGRQLLPDAKEGTQGLLINSVIDRKIQESIGRTPAKSERLHWKKPLPEEVPTITNIILHLDLTGSTHGETAKKIALLGIILKESTKFLPELRVFALASQGGSPQILLSPALPKDQEKAIIGSILATGDGQGDNEIDRNGIITALQETTKIPIPPNRQVGKTHYLFLTDGGISTTIAEKFPQSIKALLQDKNMEFDMLVIGDTENTATKAIETATWPIRKPTVLNAQTAGQIAKEAVLHLTNQIRRNRVLQPRSEKKHHHQTRRTSQTLNDIGMD